MTQMQNCGNMFMTRTTTSEIVFKGKNSNSQLIANRVVEWSSHNKVQLNSEKCKERGRFSTHYCKWETFGVRY